MNNEIFGISCEIAIADAFNVPVNAEYRERGDIQIINKMALSQQMVDFDEK